MENRRALFLFIFKNLNVMFTIDTFEYQTYWQSAKQYILVLLLQDLPYFSISSGTVMVSIFPDLGGFLADSKIHFIPEID